MVPSPAAAMCSGILTFDTDPKSCRGPREAQAQLQNMAIAFKLHYKVNAKPLGLSDRGVGHSGTASVKCSGAFGSGPFVYA